MASAGQLESPPYEISTAVNDDNAGSTITVVTGVLLVLSTLLLALRLWIRYPWKALVGSDDVVTAVAHVVGLAQTIVVFVAVSHGLGKKPHLLPAHAAPSVEKLVYAGDILFVLTTWLSRVAVAVLFLRLLPSRTDRPKKMRIAVFAIPLAAIVCLFVVAIRPEYSEPWTGQLATTTLHRWIVAGALGSIVEIILVVLAVVLVWSLQMPTRVKLTVVSGFAFRLTIIATLVIRIVSLDERGGSTAVPSAYTIPELWTQAEMHLSLICATVPCLRIFLKSFNTGYYGMAIVQLDPSGTIMATKGSESYNLSNMKSNISAASGNRYNISNPTPSNPAMTTSSVIHELRDSTSERSDRGILVRQTVNIEYDQSQATRLAPVT